MGEKTKNGLLKNKSTFMRDLILVIIGVILGFLASLCTIKYQECVQRKKAIEICKLELLKINKFVKPISSSVGVISMTNIPNFSILTQSDILLYLDKDIRETIIEAIFNLENAEKTRELYWKDTSQVVIGESYFEWLKSTKLSLEELNNKLSKYK